MKRKLGVAFSIIGAALVIISISGLEYAGHNPLSNVNSSNQGMSVNHSTIVNKLDSYSQIYGFGETGSNISNLQVSGTEIQLIVTNLSFNNPNWSGYTIEAKENNLLLSYLLSILHSNSNGSMTKMTLIPIYSNTMNNTQTANISNHKSSTNSSLSSVSVKTDGYPAYEVQNVYSTGWLGWFLSFNQPGTFNLIQDMTYLSALVAFLSYLIGALVVAAFITFLAAALMGLGAYWISNLDASGGNHGVYFDGFYGTLTGWGTPWTHSVPWWA